MKTKELSTCIALLATFHLGSRSHIIYGEKFIFWKKRGDFDLIQNVNFQKSFSKNQSLKDKQLTSWILTKSQKNNMLSNIKDQTRILIRRFESQTSQYAFKINK